MRQISDRGCLARGDEIRHEWEQVTVRQTFGTQASLGWTTSVTECHTDVTWQGTPHTSTHLIKGRSGLHTTRPAFRKSGAGTLRNAKCESLLSLAEACREVAANSTTPPLAAVVVSTLAQRRYPRRSTVPTATALTPFAAAAGIHRPRPRPRPCPCGVSFAASARQPPPAVATNALAFAPLRLTTVLEKRGM